MPGRQAATHFAVVLAAICPLLWQGSALAENLFSIYSGTSITRNSDLRISQPGAGTGLTIRDVQWNADPFKAAPYYGLRLTHYFEQRPNWGLALDFTHYKIYAQTDRIVPVDGSWRGTAVSGNARMDQYVQRFEISHGVNMLSLNGIYRWLPPGDARLQPYVGIGLAYYRPHSENTVDNLAHETGYQSSGFGYHLLGGVQYRLSDRWGAFVEAKFNSGTANVDIANGQAETSLRTFHAVGGLNFKF